MPKLTPRQKQVALLYAEGHAQKEIAHILNISFQTVKTHIANIYIKLEVRKKCELRREVVK